MVDLTVYAKRLVAIAILVAVVLGYIVVPAITASSAKPSISPYPDPNDPTTDWFKVSDLAANLSKEVNSEGNPRYELLSMVSSPALLRNVADPDRVCYVALGIEHAYRQSEVDALLEHYRRGGCLVIADDTHMAHANDLALEFNVHFLGGPLWDRNFDNNISFPRIHAELSGDQYELILNSATGLVVPPANESLEADEQPLRVLANGSKDSFVDRDNDGKVSLRDAQGFIPVVVEVRVPDDPFSGHAVFISDPGIFINEMVARGGGKPGTDAEGHGNIEFVTGLLEYLLPAGGKIIFDESRHDSDSYSSAVYDSLETATVITSDPLMIGLVFTGTALILAMVILKAKDKENWIHRFDINTISRRRQLPDQRRVVQDRLRYATMRKVRMINSMGEAEISALSPPQLAQLIPDPQLRELYLNQEREWSPEELRQVTAKLKEWKK